MTYKSFGWENEAHSRMAIKATENRRDTCKNVFALGTRKGT